MKWLQLIFSHSLFVSLCAAALCIHSSVLLSIETDFRLPALVFCCSLAAYNAYWIIAANNREERPFWVVSNSSLPGLIIMLSAFTAGIYFFSKLPFMSGPLLISAGLCLFYFLPLLWPRQTALFGRAGPVKTLLLAAAWSYVTVRMSLPSGVISSGMNLWLVSAQRFFFMLMLCIIFDSRDIKSDRLLGLKSLATEVSGIVLRAVFYYSFALFLFFTILLHGRLVCSLHTPVSLIAGFASAGLFKLSSKPQGYFFYYFLVDGLMLLLASSSLICAFFD